MTTARNKSYNTYDVVLTNIQWDVGQPGDYPVNVISALPKQKTLTIKAPDAECAKDWAMDDFCDDSGFLIQSCEAHVNKVQSGIDTYKVSH